MPGDNESNESADDTEIVTELKEVQFIGPATAEQLAASSFDARDVVEKRISYEMLVDAGVNPGVATRIRREHSLSWSMTGDGRDLDQRSNNIRGLKDGERAWIAASAGDWEDAEPASANATTDGSGTSEDAERAWRDRSAPEPVTQIDGVDEDLEVKLGEAGITSIRTLAVADPDDVADSLDLDADRVAEWRTEAERLEQ